MGSYMELGRGGGGGGGGRVAKKGTWFVEKISEFMGGPLGGNIFARFLLRLALTSL